MSKSQRHIDRHRLDLRQQGRRRVVVVTRSMTMAGTALAAVFGVVLAQHSPVAATQPPATTRPATPAPASSTAPPAVGTTPVPAPPITTVPPAPVTTNPAPQLQLQPPVAPPAPAIGNSSNGSSGGS